MIKFVEIYFHFEGQDTIRRHIINVDEIARVEEYVKSVATPGGRFKEYTECILIRKDGTKCVLEHNYKENVIQQLLEL